MISMCVFACARQRRSNARRVTQSDGIEEFNDLFAITTTRFGRMAEPKFIKIFSVGLLRFAFVM